MLNRNKFSMHPFALANIAVASALLLLLSGNWHKHDVIREERKQATEYVLEAEKRVQNLIDENAQLYSRLEKYEQSEVLYGISFIMSRNKSVDVKKAREIAERVVEYSSRFELDYKLVLAVIWQESRFKVNAKSGKGACGLMQIIPDTQKGIAKKLGIGKWDIHDVDTNILFGTAYLGRLKVIYNNDTRMMLSAYNGGYTGAKQYGRYVRGEIPADSLNTENLGYVQSIMNVYGKM